MSATESVDGPYVVRVFVSSTFLDMQRERDTLVRRTFPALRARFRARGLELLEVDLRWGITQSQAESGETLSICLSEIDRCRPYFIGLIGERYGWVPPDDLLTEEVQDAFPATAGAQGRSVTELEVLHAISNDPTAAKNALFFMRDPAWIESLSSEERANYEPTSEAARVKHEAFKARIEASGARVVRYGDPGEIGPAVQAAFGALLDDRFPASHAPGPFEQTFRLHEAYARERRGIHVGADEALSRLDRWAATINAPPMVVVGPSGSGKSTLIANWLQKLRAARPNDVVFEHYLGASPDSADPMLLLRRLWTFLDREDRVASGFGEAMPPPPADAGLMDVSAGLTDRIARAAAVAERRGFNIVIALDGLDKLTSEANLRWWPRALGARVKVVASCLPGEALEAADARRWSRLALRPFSRDDASSFVEQLLASWGRRLSRARIDRILAHPLAGNPLFLKSVLEELRYSAIHERLDERLGFYLGATDMPDLFTRLLERLESDLGSAAVERMLVPIWASRFGLEEHEVIALSEEAPIAWSALRNGLGDGLRDQQGRITFSHDFLRSAVTARYAPTPERQRMAHSAVAEHFASGPRGVRRAEEVPYQLQAAHAWDRLEHALVDLESFDDLRKRGDVELLGHWLPLVERGRSVEALLSAAFGRRVGPPETWSEADIGLAFALGSFFDVAGARGPAALSLGEQRTAACEMRFGKDDSRTLDSASSLAVTMLARGQLTGAQALWSDVLSRQRRALGEEHEDTLSTLSNLAQAHKELGDLAEAEMLQSLALETKTRILGADHEDTLTSLNNLADLKSARGELEAAQAMFEQVRDASLRGLGPEHPHTLTSIHNLAGVLKALGRLTEGRRLEEDVFEARLRLFGPDHPATITSVNNLAVSHLEAGEFAEAERLQQRVIDAVTRSLGPDHPDTFIALNNLAQVVDDRGDVSGAVRLFQRAADGTTRVLGREHPLTLTVLNNLAEALKGAGALERAVELQREVYGLRVRVSGPEHPHTLSLMNNMANTALEQGRPEEAVALAEQVVEATSRKMGPDHPDTLVAQTNLAGALMTRGALEPALTLYGRVLDKTSSMFGADHPDTLSAVMGVAQARQTLGDISGAVELYRRAYEARRRLLGPRHPDTMDSAAGLGGGLRAAGDLSGSQAILTEAASFAADRWAPDHRITLSMSGQLASTLKAQGNLDEALSLETEVYDGWTKRYGLRHPETLTARNNMAQTLYSRGDYAQARPHFEAIIEARRAVNGPDHPNTLLAAVNLAQTRKALGDVDGAQALEEEALEGLMSVAGPEHPMTLATKSNLVGSYRFRGELEAGRALEAEVVEVRRRVFGLGHPDTLQSLNVLGELHYALGDLDSAIECLSQSHEGRQQVLGAAHPETLTTQMSLGAVVWAAGDLDRAEQLFRDAHAQCLEHLGPDHPLTTHAVGGLDGIKAQR